MAISRISIDYDAVRELMDRASEVYVFDLTRYLMRIPEELRQVVVEPDEGLYTKGGLIPFLPKGNYYKLSNLYQGEDTLQPLTFEEILGCSDAIVDRFGDTVLPVQLNRSNLFSTTPSINPNLINILLSVALDTLYGCNSHFNNTNFEYKIRKFVKRDEMGIDIEEAFRSVLDPIVEEVLGFIGRDTWHLYFHKVVNTTLILEKTLDYRVLDWMRQQGFVENLEDV